MAFLKLASRKIFMENLAVTDDHTQLGSSVWIQGHVVQVATDGCSAVLNDGTGTVLLTACDKAASKVTFTEGMYVMCVGGVQQTGANPVVKPVKLQDLSQVDHVENMWPLEVRDQNRFLAS